MSASLDGGGEQLEDAMDTIYEMSKLLNTGLDREALTICVKLCDAGVNPEALAAVVKELRKEGASQPTDGGVVQ